MDSLVEFQTFPRANHLGLRQIPFDDKQWRRLVRRNHSYIEIPKYSPFESKIIFTSEFLAVVILRPHL